MACVKWLRGLRLVLHGEESADKIFSLLVIVENLVVVVVLSQNFRCDTVIAHLLAVYMCTL